MIYVKPAHKWNPLDIIAAKQLREQGDASPVSWLTHLEWWFAQGHVNCWFATAGWTIRCGYVRVNKANVVSISISDVYRGRGIGLQLLNFLRDAVKGDLIAYVRSENRPSYELFRKAGYEVNRGTRVTGVLLELVNWEQRRAA